MVVADLSETALAEAAALDERFAKDGPVGPLHGVPVTIKINVDQKGHATSNGVAAFSDVIAPDDAPVVRNLKAAGATVIGRTNTPEFSFRADTQATLATCMGGMPKSRATISATGAWFESRFIKR